MYLDHKNFQYFMIIHVLNQHQAQWALSLSIDKPKYNSKPFNDHDKFEF